MTPTDEPLYGAAAREVRDQLRGDAYQTARVLADNGHTDPDAVTRADFDAAADIAGVDRPTSSEDRHNVRAALEAIAAEPEQRGVVYEPATVEACQHDYREAEARRKANGFVWPPVR